MQIESIKILWKSEMLSFDMLYIAVFSLISTANLSQYSMWFCDNDRKTVASDGKDFGVCVCVWQVLVTSAIPETGNSFRRLSPFHDLDGDDSEYFWIYLLQSFIGRHDKKYFVEHTKLLKKYIC